ncbi:MAG: glycosyltransferase [Desulfobacteraceae bacterium]|nr:MAG: glycosyltransferase [Desulfobacteraceae bacterium]
MFTSVIIPAFNDPRIQIALEALLKQTCPKDQYEIIIADNGSTDDTRSIIESYCNNYPDHILIVHEKKIQSSYAARNKALHFARGNYIAFTDSDCIPDKDWVKNGISALIQEGANCGGGRIDFFFKSNQPNIYEYLDSARKLDQKSYILSTGFAATANFFIKRDLFEKYGEFRHDLISGGDYEFGRRLTNAGEKIIYIPNAVVRHPARNSFKQIFKKTVRVAKGQNELASFGLLDHEKITWRNWLPKLRYPIDHQWSRTHSLIEKVQLTILVSLFRYINLWERIR